MTKIQNSKPSQSILVTASDNKAILYAKARIHEAWKLDLLSLAGFGH